MIRILLLLVSAACMIAGLNGFLAHANTATSSTPPYAQLALLPVGVILAGASFKKVAAFLWTALSMVLLGAFPWLYTPLVWPHRHAEIAGLIFIFMGLPGLCALLIGLAIKAVKADLNPDKR